VALAYRNAAAFAQVFGNYAETVGRSTPRVHPFAAYKTGAK